MRTSAGTARTVALSMSVVLTIGAGMGADGAAGSSEHADDWLLVRLEAPVPAAAVGSVPPRSGIATVDAVVAETGIQRIEPALPVSLRDPVDPGALRRRGLDRTYRFHVPPGSDVVQLVRRFSGVAGVVYAEPDPVGGVGARVPDDSRFDDQWAYRQFTDADVDGPEAWDVAVGEGVLVAVLDTGADSNHEDLAAKLEPGYDFENDDPSPEDDHGHGSATSSIVSADTDNGRGIAGACWGCRLLPVKVWDQNGAGPQSQTADGIVWATDRGARVINVSGGYFSGSQTLLDAVRYAWDAGAVLVSITHNQNTDDITYPGRYAETIAVGATDDRDERVEPFCFDSAPGSNYGPEIDVVAPGDLVVAANIGGGYASWCGTSMAAPLVSGLLGIVHTIHPSVGREEARHLLHSGAEDQVGRMSEDAPGFDVYHGWGRVNMERTVRAAASTVTLRVDGAFSTRVYYETANPVAGSYDFVRGRLDALAETVGGVDLGDVVCLENDSLDPDTVGDEDTGIPAPGDGFFYLGRFNAAPGAGSYGGSSRNRDREPATHDCAP